MDSITLITFSIACWLALYLIARNNHPRTRLTGAGLLAYALVLGLQFTLSGEIWERVNWALLGNSIFSFLSGLDFALFSRPLADFLGLSSPTIILVLGLGLIAYASSPLHAIARAAPEPAFCAFCYRCRPALGTWQRGPDLHQHGRFHHAWQVGHRHHRRYCAGFRHRPIYWPASHHQFLALTKSAIKLAWRCPWCR